MNIQDYISSGIVESYVLGLATPEERTEFEQLCSQYPELLAARVAFELALEKQAVENAILPSPGLRERIAGQIRLENTAALPVQAPIRKMTGSRLKYAVAACLLLLAGSLYWNISLYNKNKKLRAEYNNTVARLNNIEADRKLLQQTPSVKMASMKGMEASPASFATVYWDTTSHDVYLLINNLPQPASDKQYQVWALLDGKPIDLGMIDNEYFVKQERLLVKAKSVQQAQAFAITLEKKGGNPTPQGAMYVLGKF